MLKHAFGSCIKERKRVKSSMMASSAKKPKTVGKSRLKKKGTRQLRSSGVTTPFPWESLTQILPATADKPVIRRKRPPNSSSESEKTDSDASHLPWPVGMNFNHHPTPAKPKIKVKEKKTLAVAPAKRKTKRVRGKLTIVKQSRQVKKKLRPKSPTTVTEPTSNDSILVPSCYTPRGQTGYPRSYLEEPSSAESREYIRLYDEEEPLTLTIYGAGSGRRLEVNSLQECMQVRPLEIKDKPRPVEKRLRVPKPKVTTLPPVVTDDKTGDLSYLFLPTLTPSPDSPLDPARHILRAGALDNYARKNLIIKIYKESLKNKRVYAVLGVRLDCIDAAMRKRGWVQKYGDPHDKSPKPGSYNPAPDEDYLFASNLINMAQLKLIWIHGTPNWCYIGPFTYVNTFPNCRQGFSTKVGLTRALVHQQHWVFKEGIADVFYPRTFTIHDASDKKHFAANFRLTACVSMLKFFVLELHGFADDGKVSLEALDFAISRIAEYLNYKEHSDIDHWNVSVVTAVDWKFFLDSYYALVHKGEKFKINDGYRYQGLICAIHKVLNLLRAYWPELIVEGYNNMWIIKPGASSRGRGIRIMNNLSEIERYFRNRHHYIVQKYIERPMLIYSTKFDIRQWFLVTSIYPLTVYMYIDCYLRFSSQLYSLKNFHPSLHLCNNAIQEKYFNTHERDPRLPVENMWDSNQFKSYLRERGELEMWQGRIAPMMQRAFVASMLSSQDQVVYRTHSFMLLGADFLLTEDFTPWLIEINTHPCMSPSTSTTARMCKEVIEDTVKDKKENPKAKTGRFRPVYKQKIWQSKGIGCKNELRLKGEKLFVDPKKQGTGTEERRRPPREELVVDCEALRRSYRRPEPRLAEEGRWRDAGPALPNPLLPGEMSTSLKKTRLKPTSS